MAFSSYTRFLRTNSAAVSFVEVLISNVTWLLPKRFSASEVPAEVANSVSGLFSVLNDSLLADTAPTPLQLLLSCVHQVQLSPIHQRLYIHPSLPGWPAGLVPGRSQKLR
jgi:hypothetical protein